MHEDGYLKFNFIYGILRHLPNSVESICIACDCLIENQLLDNMVFAMEFEKFSKIKELNLSINGFSNYILKFLAQCENVQFLEFLRLSYLKELSAEGIEYISNSPYIKNLKYLDLYDSRIGDEEALAIAQSKNFSELMYLDLRGNDVGFDGAQAILKSADLPKLKVLVLNHKLFEESPHSIQILKNIRKDIIVCHKTEAREKSLYEKLFENHCTSMDMFCWNNKIS